MARSEAAVDGGLVVGRGGLPRARLKERGRRVWSGLREVLAGVVVGGCWSRWVSWWGWAA